MRELPPGTFQPVSSGPLHKPRGKDEQQDHRRQQLDLLRLVLTRLRSWLDGRMPRRCCCAHAACAPHMRHAHQPNDLDRTDHAKDRDRAVAGVFGFGDLTVIDLVKAEAHLVKIDVDWDDCERVDESIQRKMYATRLIAT